MVSFQQIRISFIFIRFLLLYSEEVSQIDNLAEIIDHLNP